MPEEYKPPLKVFLCHASGDKPQVRGLYKRLVAEGVDAWLDQEKLLPGQDWRVEIPRAVREADVVVICLSNKSITKEGYIQKEIKFALDVAEEKPEGSIFLIPARLEECPVPDHLGRWQWVDLYEENGFVKLLRSLKLRANKVGAVIEPPSQAEDDQETEHRINQLYTEGLAAFYTEDWDKACRRFQTILSERPNHRGASEKLEEAERQRDLAKLYVQSSEAYRSEDWNAAIKWLEEISRKSSDYKDVSQLLTNARQQKQLGEFHAEAKTLHAAQKWQAVVKVFAQISTIDPTYQDADGLLTSAQKELDELKRLAELNDLYTNAIHEMDSSRWYEARKLLEQVHKSQMGFLDTERLLKKVESEILKIEELNKRNNQINTLYEQAHGLIRSKSWRMVLSKMEEIRKLDDQFVDKDRIFEKAKTELEHDEQAAQRQNELAAMYAEAVRLLREEKYHEALEKWQVVKTIDPKYPDRQRLQSLAGKKLRETEKSSQYKPHIVITKPLWMGILTLTFIGILISGVILSQKSNGETTLPATATSSRSNSAIPTPTSNPTTTSVPAITETPGILATIPPTIVSDPLMYDDFDNTAYDGNFDTAIWGAAIGDADISAGKIVQGNGSLTIKLDQYQLHDIGLNSTLVYKPTSPIFAEAKVMLDQTSSKEAVVWLGFGADGLGSQCVMHTDFSGSGKQEIYCTSFYFGVYQRAYSVQITPGTWHVLRVELYPDTMTHLYLVDGKQIGSYIPRKPDELRNGRYVSVVHVNSETDANPGVTGYIDYVKMGKIEESETKQTAYRWDFADNTEGWGDDFHFDTIAPYTKDGYLIVDSIGLDPQISSLYPLDISANQAPVITVRMRIVNGQGTNGTIFFVTDKSGDIESGDKAVEFQVKADGAFHTYNVLMTGNPIWKGIITRLRLDPVDDPSNKNMQFDIDYISVHAP